MTLKCSPHCAIHLCGVLKRSGCSLKMAVMCYLQPEKVPYWIRSKVVDLKVRKKRAEEEMEYCTLEMQQTHSYYNTIHQTLTTTLDAPGSKLSKGQRALLLRKLHDIERRCFALHASFSPYTAIDKIETYFVTCTAPEPESEADIDNSQTATETQTDDNNLQTATETETDDNNSRIVTETETDDNDSQNDDEDDNSETELDTYDMLDTLDFEESLYSDADDGY